jgi:hypothetical protein
MLLPFLCPYSPSLALQIDRFPAGSAGFFDTCGIAILLLRLLLGFVAFPHQMSWSMMFKTLLRIDMNVKFTIVPLQPLPSRHLQPLFLLLDGFPQFNCLFLIRFSEPAPEATSLLDDLIRATCALPPHLAQARITPLLWATCAFRFTLASGEAFAVWFTVAEKPDVGIDDRFDILANFPFLQLGVWQVVWPGTCQAPASPCLMLC